LLARCLKLQRGIEVAFTEIDTDELFTRMFGAAKQDAGQAWGQIKGVCKVELKAIAREIKEVGKSVSLNDISQESGRTMIRLSRAGSAATLTALTPITISTAESVINSAMDEVRDSVVKAVGFYLL
jgi:hypothetical protein